MSPLSALSKPVCVLVYGSEELLIRTRAMVLARAGFDVYPALNENEAVKILQTQRISLVVLCHTLSAHQCENALMIAVRANPAVRTLLLTAGGSVYREQDVSGVLSAFDGPVRLVETVNDLVQVPSAL